MTIQEAKDFLRSEGYFVDILWHVSSVQDNFKCTDEEAQDVLYWALTNDFVIDLIDEKITDAANNEGLEEIEEL